MQAIKLKNGSEELGTIVTATMISIEHLWQSGIPGMLIASDLVQICRDDPSYKAFDGNEAQLKELGLLQADGKPHSSIRNIVLSAFTGEGLQLSLGSPVES